MMTFFINDFFSIVLLNVQNSAFFTDMHVFGDAVVKALGYWRASEGCEIKT